MEWILELSLLPLIATILTYQFGLFLQKKTSVIKLQRLLLALETENTLGQ